MSADNLNKKKRIKGAYGLWRIIYLSVWGISAAGIILAIAFIYQNIFLTALNATVIREFVPNTDWFSLDWKGYEKIKITLNAKKELRQAPLRYKNIFVYNAPINAAATTTPYASSTSGYN
jgi:hypothetical protein